MNEHEIMIDKLLEHIDLDKINSVLDLGTGRTSMNLLLKRFNETDITGICYPGDERKISSVKNNCIGKYKLEELDICTSTPKRKYDFVLCHLLLGETLKFGNTIEKMIDSIFKINSNMLCVVDYLEDVDINFELLKSKAQENGYSIQREIIVKKEEEEQYEKFVGKNYIGYLMVRKELSN